MQAEPEESPEKNKETVQKLLREPVMPDFTEPVRKMRTHLLIGSSIGVAVGWYDLKINVSNAVFGVQLDGLTPQALQWGLFWVVLYLFVHFVWGSWDQYLEWKNRLTGQKILYKQGHFAGPESLEFEADPSQTTLYSWWQNKTMQWARNAVVIPHMEENLNDLIAKVQNHIALPQGGIDHVLANQLQTISNDLSSLKSTEQLALKLLETGRISESLERFDRSFWRHSKSQLWRWILVELAVPLLLGIYAICLLVRSLYLQY